MTAETVGFVAASDPVGAPGISGSDAAAILLLLLQEREAAQLLSHLDADDIALLGRAMFGVAHVTEGEIAEAFVEFACRARAVTALAVDAAPKFHSVMREVLGDERADRMFARIAPERQAHRLESARWMDARSIAAAMEGEHPQVIAALIAHLPPEMGSLVLETLPAEKQADVVYRIATLDAVSPAALEDLEALLSAAMARPSAGATAQTGGAAEAAKLVAATRGGIDKRILRAIARVDRPLARRIEEEMFVFDDLAALDAKGMGMLLRAVDNALLVAALKGANEELREQMLACMSARAADALRDEMDDRGPLPLAEAQAAQREIVAVARAMAAEGAIMLGGQGDDYV